MGLKPRPKRILDDMEECHYQTTSEVWESGYLAALSDFKDRMDRETRTFKDSSRVIIPVPLLQGWVDDLLKPENR